MFDLYSDDKDDELDLYSDDEATAREECSGLYNLVERRWKMKKRSYLVE